MFTRILFSFCFIISMYTVSFSQGGHYGGHNENVKELCKILQTSNFSTNTAADDALDRILSVTGMSKNFTLYPCSDIKNCAAVTLNGDRYILYDKEFMEEISNSASSWSNLSILAHEIGHHVNGHTLDLIVYASGGRDAPTLARKRQEEIEADEYSGFVMQKLGATIEQSQAAVNFYGSDGDDTYSTHPNKAKRLAAIKKGYDKAKLDEKTKVIYVEKETNKVIKEEISNTSNITSGTLYDSRDGKEYKTVKIGNQIWMAENLNVNQFQNGDKIEKVEFYSTIGDPNVKLLASKKWFNSLKTNIPYWTEINEFPNYSDIFGKLYNHYAVSDPRKLCPKGWRMPNVRDWDLLYENISSHKPRNENGDLTYYNLSKSLKSKNNWKNIEAKYDSFGYKIEDGIDGNGDDDFGFKALPSNYIVTANGKSFLCGGVKSIGETCIFWTSSILQGLVEKDDAYQMLFYHSGNHVMGYPWKRSNGASVRCVKD